MFVYNLDICNDYNERNPSANLWDRTSYSSKAKAIKRVESILYEDAQNTFKMTRKCKNFVFYYDDEGNSIVIERNVVF
mgnify:CR=1 FL=1|tara:strand:- start:189 stop:422 length:234 start_codon:yes stop_codon:yes gene_type:complete